MENPPDVNSSGFALFFADAVDELGDLVLLVGEEVRIGLQDDLFGVAYPSRDGAVAHPFGQKVGDAGVAEAVHLHVRQPGLLQVFVDPPADLAVADDFGVLALAPLAFGKAPFGFPRQRFEERPHRADDGVVADRVLRLGRGDCLSAMSIASPRHGPADVELAVGEVVPFEPHELAAAEAVVEEEGEHEAVPLVVDGGEERLELLAGDDGVVLVGGAVVLRRRYPRGVERFVLLLEELDEGAVAAGLLVDVLRPLVELEVDGVEVGVGHLADAHALERGEHVLPEGALDAVVGVGLRGRHPFLKEKRGQVVAEYARILPRFGEGR